MTAPRSATAADLRKLLKQGRSKYRAKRCQCEGIWFDSRVERARFLELRLLEKQGLIHGLKVHPKYDLGSGVTYKGDFEYMKREWLSLMGGPMWADRRVIEDVKSKATRKTRDYRLKRKLFKAKFGFEITEVIR